MRLKEGNITIYADGYGLAVYGNGSPKPSVPNEWLPPKHYLCRTDPFMLTEDDVLRALSTINTQADSPGGFEIIDEATGDILEAGAYSAF